MPDVGAPVPAPKSLPHLGPFLKEVFARSGREPREVCAYVQRYVNESGAASAMVLVAPVPNVVQ